MSNHSIKLRDATRDDVDTILKLIHELAEYEKAREEVVATPDELCASLFCDSPKAHVLLAEIGSEVVGCAIYFFNYSTWLAKQGIYLEDLYVTPKARGNGAGKALLKSLAKLAIENNCGRLEWSVLDWNQPAIDFYTSFGAKPKDEWTVYRLAGDSLKNFASD